MRPGARALLTALTAACGLIGCEGGTSSETVGIVKAAPGRSGITVRTDPGIALGLYSEDFRPQANAGFAKAATADSTGRFAFADLAPGHYRLLARRASDGAAALLTDLAIPTEDGSAPSARLEPTGTLQGTVTDSLPASLGAVYVPGTPLFALADSLMHYTLAGLPAGTYRIVKTWKKPLSCEPGRSCGGFVDREDSAEVRIRAGENAVW